MNEYVNESVNDSTSVVESVNESVVDGEQASWRDRAGRSGLRQTGVGLKTETMQRVDRLRAVLGASRTRVIEMLLTEGGLFGAEKIYEKEIRRFNVLARNADTDGGTWQEYADWYAAAYSSKTFPPDINELEKIEAAARAR